MKALENNENDKEAWKNLAKSLQSTNLEEAISVFQLILKTFPTSGLFLRMFCEIQEKARNFTAVENVHCVVFHLNFLGFTKEYEKMWNNGYLCILLFLL